jgi:two-component sensor histidine kinase
MGVVGMTFKDSRDIEIANLRALLFRKERELRELHHRIANNLHLASGFLLRQRRRVTDPAVQSALDTASARLTAVGKLHRYLYAHSDDSLVDLKPFLNDLCPEIAASTGLDCDVSVESINVSGDMAQNLAIIINEFALNAAKHGYEGQDSGRLKIECRPTGSALRLVVADGGKGLPPSFSLDGETGLGLSVVGSIVKQIDGHLEAKSDQGACFTLTAPLR